MAAKVYPSFKTSASSSCNDHLQGPKLCFTIWLKSLVMNGKGWTVFDSNGKLVFRIDNYDTRRSNEVYLMDLQGNVLCTVVRKRLRYWDGYKCDTAKVTSGIPWFQLKNIGYFRKRELECEVSVQGISYKIEGSGDKSEFKIIDTQRRLVAEVKKKKSSSGVALGEDVLSLVVEQPQVDQCLIIAIVAVCELIRHKM